ncbi:hypothetical protein BCR35DRAFT_354441 [Leucosporidium creatinivorum]|uniref:RNase III domain-containing protein n=1 Tax=Leucosporidium creatinivorum TaxID=106004 RepID=A0A1Y2EMY6_9BASI|nr:hypothetical protein BCR35DRAFT_354441 [Leucosporidium creatinivorum]
MPAAWEVDLTQLESQSASFAFTTPEGKNLAMRALTHSSLSNSFNNTDLARVGELAGKAAVTERLFLDKDSKPTGADYNDKLQLFTTARLAAVGRNLRLDQVLLKANVPTASNNMVAQCLCALFGAVKIANGQQALLELLDTLGMK